MSELTDFIRSLKRQIISLIALQFFVIIAASVGFYYNTSYFIAEQKSLNIELKTMDARILDKVDMKADKVVVDKISDKLDRHIEKGTI